MPDQSEKEARFLAKARKQFDESYSSEGENRDRARDDILNLDGQQWPEALKRKRESSGRPCLTINKLCGFCDQVLGDSRQNKPSIKIRPVDSKSDPETAEVIEGLIRNIESTSLADVAYQHGLEGAVNNGFGHFRVVTEYSDDDGFYQTIKIKKIPNPMSVYNDPNAVEWDLSDAQFQFVLCPPISKDTFKERYPDKEPIDLEFADEDNCTHWLFDDQVQTAEYFVKKPVTRKLLLLNDGSIIEAEELSKLAEESGMDLEAYLQALGMSVARERETKGHVIEWYLIDGKQILEGPKEWPSKYFPCIPVWGKELWVDGKRILRGVIRNAKDSQRAYNYRRTVIAERLAMAPKAPIMATPDQIKGFEHLYGSQDNLPYLLYNPDSQAGTAIPQRLESPMPPTGDMAELQIDGQEMKETTGIYDASLGERSNETSGKAILARDRQGETATFAYIDNLSRAITLCGRIIVDLIPKIFDTPRIVRVQGIDDKEKFVQVNRPYQERDKTGAIVQKLHDLTAGKYDVAVTVGPGYTTQRLESADSMMQFIGAVPQVAPAVADLVAGAMDWPDSDKFTERLKKTLPPGLADEDDGRQQQPDPAQQQAMMAQQIAMQQQQQMMQAEQAKAQGELELIQVKIAQEQAKLEGIQLENEKKKLDIQTGMVRGMAEADGHRMRSEAHRSNIESRNQPQTQ